MGVHLGLKNKKTEILELRSWNRETWPKSRNITLGRRLNKQRPNQTNIIQKMDILIPKMNSFVGFKALTAQIKVIK